MVERGLEQALEAERGSKTRWIIGIIFFIVLIAFAIYVFIYVTGIVQTQPWLNTDCQTSLYDNLGNVSSIDNAKSLLDSIGINYSNITKSGFQYCSGYSTIVSQSEGWFLCNDGSLWHLTGCTKIEQNVSTFLDTLKEAWSSGVTRRGAPTY